MKIWYEVQTPLPQKHEGLGGGGSCTICNCLPLPPLTRFSTGLFVILQEILYQSFFPLIKLLQKIIHLKSKTNFFFQHCWLVLILLFCVYVFLRALFDSSAIMKLQIALYLYIYIASYLISHQIIWHNKRINVHGLKLQVVAVFSASKETKFKVDTTSIILNYLYHFGNVHKEFLRYC